MPSFLRPAIVPGKTGEMMAVTIRNVNDHEEMLSSLKEQTNKKTLSQALIEGGYEALRYKEMYNDKKYRYEQLESELRQLKRQVKRYFDSKNELESVAQEIPNYL